MSLRDTIYKGDYMMKIDLKDAYLAVPIVKHHRKFLRFHWQGNNYQFKTPVRAGYSSSYLYQAARTCGSRAQESGSSSGDLPGRYLSDGIISRGTEESISDAYTATARAGVHFEPQEMHFVANLDNHGLYSEFQHSFDITTGGQNPQGSEAVPQNDEQWESFGKRASTTHRPTHISKSSNDVCPIILPRTPKDENQPPQGMELVRFPSRSEYCIEGRPPLLNKQASIIPREEDNAPFCLPSYHLRCFHSGLGSKLFRFSDWWTVDIDGSTGPHKCIGAPGSFSSPKNICKQCFEPASPVIDRQHNSRVARHPKHCQTSQNRFGYGAWRGTSPFTQSMFQEFSM